MLTAVYEMCKLKPRDTPNIWTLITTEGTVLRVLDTCPHCQCSLIGKDGYQRAIGIQIWGVYDGVLYWECPDCGWAWPREFGIERRDRQSQHYVEESNARLDENEP